VLTAFMSVECEV